MDTSTFPSVGCEIVLHITPARRMEIADRLDPALPPGWEVVSEFHREVDPASKAESYESYFHRIETHNDRVDVETLLTFGERFAEIDEQLNIERAQEESPDVFEDAVESLGREAALEMFADVGGSGASLVRIGARVQEPSDDGMNADPFLKVDFGSVPAVALPWSGETAAKTLRRLVGQEFMGKLIRVEKIAGNQFLLGGDPVSDIRKVRTITSYLEADFDVDPSDTTLVCRVVEQSKPEIAP